MHGATVANWVDDPVNHELLTERAPASHAPGVVELGEPGIGHRHSPKPVEIIADRSACDGRDISPRRCHLVDAVRQCDGPAGYPHSTAVQPSRCERKTAERPDNERHSAENAELWKRLRRKRSGGLSVPPGSQRARPVCCRCLRHCVVGSVAPSACAKERLTTCPVLARSPVLTFATCIARRV